MLSALDRLPTFQAADVCLAVIEAAQGSASKFKYDPSLGAMTLHSALPLGSHFPYSFGFVPSTLGDDGDPLDVLLFMDEPAPLATVVPCRIVGAIKADQRQGKGTRRRNDRLLAVASDSHRYAHCHVLADIAEPVLDQIEKFFVFYNAQKGVHFRALRRLGAKAALKLIRRGQDAFEQTHGIS
jgi:inorganic pyrophosphatase